jgi:polysaccharide export outer membrane protein
MKTFKLALIGAAAFLLASCGSSVNVSSSAPEPLGDNFSDYDIGVGDRLAINVWRNEDLTVEVPVRPDGKISLPLVGEIQAAGQSASNLSQVLKEQLVNYIRNPQVTVIVTDAVSSDYQRRVRVTGAIEEPISVPQRAGMTILDLVLEAGGLTEFAVPNKSVLYRKTSTGVVAYPVRLGDILNKGKLDTNYELAPSDIITVPERSF